MSLRKKSVLGVFWVFIQQFSNQAVTFIISVILARLLMPSDFGLIGMVAVFMSVSQILLNSGLTQSLIRESEPTQSDYSTVFYFNIGVGIVLYIILFFAAGLIADFYSQPILTDIIRVYSFIIVINAFGAVQFTRLTKQMEFKAQMMVTVPSIIVGGAFGVILAFMDFGVWALVYMYLVQAVMRTVQIWLRSKWIPSWDFSKEKFKYHFGFSYKLGLSGLINSLYSNLYQILIGRYFSAAQLGFYTRADSMKNLPVANISTALNKVTYPLFAEIKEDQLRLKKAYKMVMVSVLFILTPVMVYLMVIAEPLFRLLLTEKWLPAVTYFQILCLSGILYPLHSYNLNILNVKGRSDLFLKIEVLKKFFGIFIIILTINFGILALIWGQVVASIMALIINSHYSGKFINYSLKQQLRDIAPTLLLASFVGIAAWAMDSNLFDHWNDIFRILVSGFIGGFLFLGSAHIFRFEAYLTILSLIKNRK